MHANNLVGLLFVILSLVGCDQIAPTSQHRYQFFAAPDGRVLRVDTIEGDVFLVEHDILMRIPEDTKMSLSIGNIYKFEDGRWMKYLGNGQFEPAQKVINWKDLPSK